MEIRELRIEEYGAAIELSWKVFQEYEAPEYSQQGIEAFYSVIHDEKFVRELKMYGAFEKEELLGILATCSNGEHIALFFVNGKYHGRGIGKSLFRLAASENHSGHMTVNSSPYAVEIYRRLGFVNLDSEQISDGIRFTPMECNEKNYRSNN